MAEHIVPEIPGLVGHEIALGDHPRLTQAVESGERRMRIVDATIDDADDDARPVTQQRPRDVSVDRRDTEVDRRRRCSQRAQQERQSRSAGLSVNSLGRPLSDSVRACSGCGHAASGSYRTRRGPAMFPHRHPFNLLKK